MKVKWIAEPDCIVLRCLYVADLTESSAADEVEDRSQAIVDSD